MNFLAHLYLSDNNSQIMIGNLIADHIRGNKFDHFPAEIQKGIFLHRKIDTFTDTHTIVKKSKRRLHERYGHYDGVIIDVFYDYFLAKNWHKYSDIPLITYTQNVYKILTKAEDILPQKTKDLLPYMIKYDWLYNYQFLEGIEEVLKGINKRTKGRSKMDLAIEDLKQHEHELQNDFFLFFDDLISFVETEFIKNK